MAYVVTDIDKYLKGNKYNFYQLITKEWGAKDEDVIKIKNLWQEAEDATGTNTKIEKFKKLKEKLQPMFDGWQKRMDKYESHLNKYKATQFSDPGDQHNYDFGKSFLKYANWPTADKFENLSLENAYGDDEGGKAYDKEQLTRLAEEYGYDYNNPEERKEFLGYVSEAARNKELDKIWNSGVDAMYTNIAAPITKEYARKNFKNIDSKKQLIGPAIADAAVNSLMTLSPAKIGKTPIHQELWGAPVARQVANMVINDKELTPAAYDAASEVATNIATPFMLRGGYRWGGRVLDQFGNEAEKTAQVKVNQMANQAYQTQKKLKAGVPYAEVSYTVSEGVKMPNGTVKPGNKVREFDKITYKKIDKKGNIKTIDEKEYLNSPERISVAELENYGKYAPVLRTKGNNATQAVAAEYSYTSPKKETISEDIARATESGRDPVDILDPGDYQALFNKKPIESKWNWATRALDNSTLWQDTKNYLTNLQGRSKYAGRAVGSLGQLVPPDIYEVKGDFLTPKKKVDQSDPEVKMYKRNYLLYKDNKDLVAEPKKPEKYKDYSIKEIFGE